MKNLIAFCAVAAMAVTTSNALAQCPTCVGGSAPAFSQPMTTSYAAPAQVYNAPVYSSPVYSAPMMNSYPQATPAYSTPIEYSSAPMASSGCSSCAGGNMVYGSSEGSIISSQGSMMSGEMTPYSTMGLPAGAVVISDVVSGEGTDDGNTVEGEVVGDAASTTTGSPTEAATPPAPQPEGDSVVPPLPTEDEGEASDDGA